MNNQWPEKQCFAQWWNEEGSAIRQIDGQDHEEHGMRIAEIAWCQALQQKRSSAIYELALRRACGALVAHSVHESPCEIADDDRVSMCVQEFIEWAESEIPRREQ